jgi:hypothetical protein
VLSEACNLGTVHVCESPHNSRASNTWSEALSLMLSAVLVDEARPGCDEVWSSFRKELLSTKGWTC